MAESMRDLAVAGEYQDVFLDLLDRAAVEVSAEYMTMQYISAQGKVEAARQERVYCYELYHQMRVLMCQADGDELAAAVADGWLLNAEVVKTLSYIPGEEIPDFIWHMQGQKRNGHVLEVKRASAPLPGIKRDVDKLRKFKAKAGYANATLLVVGEHRRPGLDEVSELADSVGVNLRFHRWPGEGLELPDFPE